MKLVRLVVSEVLMLHENTEILPSRKSHDLSKGNNDPIKRITLMLVGIAFSNQLGWLEVEKED